MANSPHIRAALAQAAFEMAPPLIRTTLIEDSEFREEHGFTADAVVTFGDSSVSVQRSDLLNAVRRLLSGRRQTRVTDTDGRRWNLNNTSAEGDAPVVAMSRAKQRLILLDLCALSQDRSTRLRSLDEAASDVNLPEIARNRWRTILEECALTDDEVDAYHSDFRDTPVHIARSIRSEVQAGTSNVSSLVPPSRRYFKRLVGIWDRSPSIRDYASGCVKAHFRQLSAWRPYEGFLFSLFLSSHSSLTAEIDVEQLVDEELVRAFDFVDEHGDTISQLGAIEVGLRILPQRPKIEPVVSRLVGHIRDDDVNGPISGFKLLSALFSLVDGELSRTRILAAEPPFYRRLAALSQAALIHRQLVNTAVDFDKFSEWAFGHRGAQFYLQSLADMRKEARWTPDLAAASQMKAEFFGRIMIAANNYEQNITGTALADVVLRNKPGSLHALSDSYHPYLPGPLEGGDDSPVMLPQEMEETIKAQLAIEEVGPSSFIALVNSALIFRVDQDQAELAATALKLGSYRLSNVEDRSQLLAVLNGLAAVAAAARSHKLADELRVLVRRHRHDPQYTLSIEEVVRICLVAGASRTDLNDWRAFVGDWLTELAFGDLKADEGKILYSSLHYLCHAVPELWITCGRADAALMAFNAR